MGGWVGGRVGNVGAAVTSAASSPGTAATTCTTVIASFVLSWQQQVGRLPQRSCLLPWDATDLFTSTVTPIHKANRTTRGACFLMSSASSGLQVKGSFRVA